MRVLRGNGNIKTAFFPPPLFLVQQPDKLRRESLYLTLTEAPTATEDETHFPITNPVLTWLSLAIWERPRLAELVLVGVLTNIRRRMKKRGDPFEILLFASNNGFLFFLCCWRLTGRKMTTTIPLTVWSLPLEGVGFIEILRLDCEEERVKYDKGWY